MDVQVTASVWPAQMLCALRGRTRGADAKGFKPLPLRWRVEATFGTLSNRWHRLTCNLEQSPRCGRGCRQHR